MFGTKEDKKESGAGEETPPSNRLWTGIPRLDFILKGGFIRGSVYSLIGPPGSGKTIFSNQLCFNAIALEGASCVYITLLVESHAKIVQHLSELEFFRPEEIPERLYFVGGYQTLREKGLAGLLSLVRQVVQDRKATILVIDGLESAAAYAQNDLAMREFLHELQAIITLFGCTGILASQKGEYHHPENTIVDGIIELSDVLVGPRAIRELTVHKFRGSDYLRGRHEVEITHRGLVIHPRTEVQFSEPPAKAEEQRERLRFGIKRLDEMMGGGLPSGSATVLLGAPGTGKTLLGLHFLVEGAKRGQKGIYFGFYEPPPRLIEKATSIGIPLRKYVDAGLIEIVWQPPLEHMLDSLAERLLERIKREESPRRRLVIDGIEGFRAAAAYPDRVPRFLSAFFNQLRMSDVTSVITEELGLFQPTIDMPNPELANVAEAVVLLRYVELRSQIYRLLSIMKMRESKHDTSIREFRITDDGVEVADSFKSAESILTGHPRGAPPERKGRRR